MWHKLDESSPLWLIRDSLDTHLDGIEISISAFDTASVQPVKLFHRYSKADLREDMVFVNTFCMNSRNPTQLQADHSKLDHYEPEDESLLEPSRKREPSGFRARARASVTQALRRTNSGNIETMLNEASLKYAPMPVPCLSPSYNLSATHTAHSQWLSRVRAGRIT